MVHFQLKLPCKFQLKEEEVDGSPGLPSCSPSPVFAHYQAYSRGWRQPGRLFRSHVSLFADKARSLGHFDDGQMVELEDAVSKMSIIHVAGTKGKGSTCTFSESILRECGYKTGLFTSPHLIDVRERFKINRADVSEDIFLKHFWWCWDRLKMECTSDVPMPTYFRFLTILAFKIFSYEKVDVAILEVGLGGRFDSTNVVENPAVCGISSLGFDHMEILGYTLADIAWEKAGILKPGVPAVTVPQPEEAMKVLKKRASDLSIPLTVVFPLELRLLKGLQLNLEGDHQLLNAALAVALCTAWAERRQDEEHIRMLENAKSEGHLPLPYINGLVTAQLPGRAQQIQDPLVKGLTFFLDGAHSPESMEVCARWFCSSVHKLNYALNENTHEKKSILTSGDQKSCTSVRPDVESLPRRVLLFNCMPQREPNLLLPPLLNVCNNSGLPFHQAVFVPGISSYTRLDSSFSSVRNGGVDCNSSSISNGNTQSDDREKDLSWQCLIQRTWDNLIQSRSEGYAVSCANQVSNSVRPLVAGKVECFIPGKLMETREISGGWSSAVVPSLPVALHLLRQYVQDHPSLQLQVLVTGSLHLVGDVLRLLKK